MYFKYNGKFSVVVILEDVTRLY